MEVKVFINNSLQFSILPPPNAHMHKPNYSLSINAILAEKMNAWGVLVPPEVVGINAEFVLPSMLVLKPEKGEYILVTDFNANTSATIAQARSRIAKSEYVIHLDLSNYFYQNGMQ